jgi:hypothetical protein
MSTLRVSRPAIDEAAAYYQTYIAEVGGDNIGEQLAEQLSQVERLFSRLDDATALSRYAPGKWSIKELLGHLNDAERIFSYRLLRISRGDSTPLPGFDQNPYVVAGRFDERLLLDLVGEFRSIRLCTVALASGIPADAWTQRGVASEYPVSARALLYIILGHVAHHLLVLRDRYGLGSGKSAATAANR